MTTNEDRLRNHWWWRPGWHVGQRLYACHLALEGEEELHRAASAYQDALKGFPNLDLIPARWFHLTMQSIGFVSDTPREDLDRIIAVARANLAGIEPAAVTFDRPTIASSGEAIIMAAQPIEWLARLRNAVRAAISDVWDAARVPTASGPFRPHVSLAYVNDDSPAEPVQAALDAVREVTPTAVISSVPVLVFHRDNRMYEWTQLARLPVGSKGADR